MNLLPKEIEERLPKLYSTEQVPAEEKIAVVKFFFPAGRGTWFAVEGQREENNGYTFFGFVVSPLGPDCDEWGYFSLSELESVEVRGLRIERDEFFRPTRFSDLGVFPADRIKSPANEDLEPPPEAKDAT